MANSCTVLTGSGPATLELDPLFATGDFGSEKDIHDRCRLPK